MGTPGLRQPILLENAPLVKQGIPFAKRSDVALFIHQLDGVQLGLELSPYGGKIYAVKLLLLLGFLGRQRSSAREFSMIYHGKRRMGRC